MMRGALLLLALLGQATAIVRNYYIAAEEFMWNYAPTGLNTWDGTAITEGDAAIFLVNGPETIGAVYKKAHYVQYTDATFTEKVVQPKWMGNLGPTIRAEVGDTIEIVFSNDATLPYSMHPHGVFYEKESEGVNYQFAVGIGGAVPPGEKFTYTWEVPERAGPGPADGPALMWAYHSHNNEPADVYSGLLGALIVYLPGNLGEDGVATDVDLEFITILQVTNENASHYLEDNCTEFGCMAEVDPDMFEESNLMHGINGYMYGNLPGLFMPVGANVRWFAAAFGTEVDLHTLHWHGNTLLMDEHRTDVVDLMPASFRTLYMIPDAPGTWLLHCHVNDHIVGGMFAYYTVLVEPIAEEGDGEGDGEGEGEPVVEAADAPAP